MEKRNGSFTASGTKLHQRKSDNSKHPPPAKKRTRPPPPFNPDLHKTKNKKQFALQPKYLNVSAGRVIYERAKSRRERHRSVLMAHSDDAVPLGRGGVRGPGSISEIRFVSSDVHDEKEGMEKHHELMNFSTPSAIPRKTKGTRSNSLTASVANIVTPPSKPRVVIGHKNNNGGTNGTSRRNSVQWPSLDSRPVNLLMPKVKKEDNNGGTNGTNRRNSVQWPSLDSRPVNLLMPKVKKEEEQYF